MLSQTLNHAIELAQATTTTVGGSTGGGSIQSTEVYRMLTSVMAALGVLIILIGMIKIGAQVLNGKAQGALRQSGTIILVGGLLVTPTAADSLIGIGAKVVKAIIDTIGGVI